MKEPETCLAIRSIVEDFNRFPVRPFLGFMLSYNTTSSLSNNSSREISYSYYHGLNLVIGILAMVANGFLLVILTYFVENRRQTTNVLIINQTSMDLISSIGVIVTYAPNDFTTTYSPDSLGYAMCLLFHGSLLQYTALFSSIMGLTVIAGERYVKIVHSILHRKHYRPWMIYYMVALPWVCSATASIFFYTENTVIMDGRCCPIKYYSYPAYRLMNAYGLFVVTYLCPVGTFSFCYASIALFIRRRSATVGVQSVSGETVQATQAKRKQLNVIKILAIISSVFVFSWLPSQLIEFMSIIGYPVDYDSSTWCLVSLIHLQNLLWNPIMYAWQYESVRNSIKKLVFKQETTQQ